MERDRGSEKWMRRETKGKNDGGSKGKRLRWKYEPDAIESNENTPSRGC